jgi:PAS domain S-box-containing protein
MDDIGARDQQPVMGEFPARRTRNHIFSSLRTDRESPLAVLGPPLACGLAYFLAAHLGRWLAFPFAPVSALWAPNAILLAALLLAPYRRWWRYLLAVLPFHLLAQAPVFPLPLVAVHYAFNCGEALLGSYLILQLSREPRRFDRLQTMTILVVFAAFLAPLLTSLLTGAFIAQGMTDRFWPIVIVRTATNAFAILTLVPLIAQAERWLHSSDKAPPAVRRALEAAVCGSAVAAVGYWVYVRPLAGDPTPALLYAPLPLLLWATVRFGIAGTCVSELLLSLLSTWGILQGRGPFAAELPLQNALSFVFFQLVTCIPLLFLAALVEERRHTARAYIASEARFRIIFENNIIPTLIWRDDFRIQEVNEAFLRLTGFTRADVISGRVQCDELVRSYRDWEHRQPRTRTPVHEFDPIPMELKLSNGRCAPIVVGGGRFGEGHSGGVIYALDLSEFRSAEAGRRRAEGLHSAVLASLNDQVAVLDRDGFVLETNASWLRFTESIVAPSFHRLLPGENFLRACGAAEAAGDRVAGAQLEAVASVLGKRSVRQNLEFSLPSVTRGETWFEFSVEVLHRQEGGAVVTRTDISTRKQAETDARSQRQQLAHLSRAAVLGQLSGALAHELNQPLTSIRGNAEAGLQLLANGEHDLVEIREILRDIVQDDERAVQVIQRLRGLLRKGEIQAQAVDLNAVVRQVLDITRSDIISRNVCVETRLDPRGTLVLADRVQMQQVLLNLVINACEAMAGIAPHERKLRIATDISTGGNRVELKVQDVGCGIEPGDLERIFEPFVTTKAEGLGLGLAICRSIVHAHDGLLWADNVAEGGVILNLSLPVAAMPPRPALP